MGGGWTRKVRGGPPQHRAAAPRPNIPLGVGSPPQGPRGGSVIWFLRELWLLIFCSAWSTAYRGGLATLPSLPSFGCRAGTWGPIGGGAHPDHLSHTTGWHGTVAMLLCSCQRMWVSWRLVHSMWPSSQWVVVVGCAGQDHAECFHLDSAPDQWVCHLCISLVLSRTVGERLFEVHFASAQLQRQQIITFLQGRDSPSSTSVS